MILGRVRGSLVSTINHPFFDNQRMLLVDYIDPDGSPTGKYVIAVDTVDAGAGEAVLIVDEGNSARQIVGDQSAPLRSVIIGIVDQINFKPKG